MLGPKAAVVASPGLVTHPSIWTYATVQHLKGEVMAIEWGNETSNETKKAWREASKKAVAALSKEEARSLRKWRGLIYEFFDEDVNSLGPILSDGAAYCVRTDDPVVVLVDFDREMPVVLLNYAELKALPVCQREVWMLYAVACALIVGEDWSFNTDRAPDRLLAWAKAMVWVIDREYPMTHRLFAAELLNTECEIHREKLATARRSLAYLSE